MTTVNKALIGLLALQIVVLLGMGLGGGSDRLALAEAVDLLPGLEASKVTTLKIFGPSKDGAGQEQVELVRKGDGWVIGGADDFPAKKAEVERLVDTLAALRSRNEVLSGATYHEKLEVAAEAYRRKVVVASGSESQTLFVGSSPSFKNVHVRRDGNDTVYQVADLSESDAGARAWSWVDRTYVKIPKEELWSVTVENEHGKIQLDRDPASNAWAALGVKKALDTSVVDGLVADVRDIGLETPVGKSAPAGAELGKAAKVTLVTGSSTIAGVPPSTTETVVIEVGTKVDGKDRRWARASTSPYVVEVAGWEVKKLVETKREDLIKKEEEKKDGK